MANVVRVRVELKKKYNDNWRNFKELLHEFKREVGKARIAPDFKDHQRYESKSVKDRKKRRDANKLIMIESIEKKLIAGEKSNASVGIVKKVRSIMKKKEEEKKKKENRYFGQL